MSQPAKSNSRRPVAADPSRFIGKLGKPHSSAVIKTKSSLTSNTFTASQGFEEVGLIRRLPGISILAALGLISFALAAQAQTTNIDKGKTSAEVFAADCAVCHKSVKGLASGQNSFTLSGFLKDHYTTSREQASALAAYVLGSGGGAAAPADKPDRARTATSRAQNRGNPSLLRLSSLKPGLRMQNRLRRPKTILPLRQ